MTEPEIVLKKTAQVSKACGQCGSEKHPAEKCKGIAPIKCPNCGEKISAWEERTVIDRKTKAEKVIRLLECGECQGEE